MATRASHRHPFVNGPVQGVQLMYFSLKPDERIRLLERFLAEGHGPSVRAARRRLRTMQPGDTYYKNFLHYVTVMPGTLRRCRRELARLRRAVAKRDAQRGQDR